MLLPPAGATSYGCLHQDVVFVSDSLPDWGLGELPTLLARASRSSFRLLLSWIIVCNYQIPVYLHVYIFKEEDPLILLVVAGRAVQCRNLRLSLY